MKKPRESEPRAARAAGPFDARGWARLDVLAALAQDVGAAARFDSDGTPIVAVNGRKGTSFAPFLCAMVLTRGNADHPAFAALPPGDPGAHLH